jgi:hypothetical protein
VRYGLLAFGPFRRWLLDAFLASQPHGNRECNGERRAWRTAIEPVIQVLPADLRRVRNRDKTFSFLFADGVS